jgi:hypothetical protein
VNRTCGKNSRKKNCEESVSVYPRRNKSVGKPRHRWLDDVENDLKKMGVRGWRKKARDTDVVPNNNTL